MSEETMEKIRAVTFATILSLISGFLIVSAVNFLKDKQDLNVLNDRRVNILRAVGLVEEGRKYTFDEIEQLYTDNIQSHYITPDGKCVPEKEKTPGSMQIYLYMKGEEVVSYILPINTRGLWGKILGYLALKADGATIQGFTVYSHQETPGLGGEIESRWFQKNFVGKKIVDAGGDFVSVKIAKGSAPEGSPNYVDGISGATLTGKFLTSGLKQILLDYEPVSLRFRSGKIGKKNMCN